MQSKTTIHDVARAAGVSITAVSHALNGKGTLSAATRQRIIEAADRLGYQPDPLARGMRSGPLGVIGLMLRPLDTLGTYRPSGVDYFTRLTGAVAVECLERNLSVMLVRDLSKLPRPPLALALDGYIIADPLEADPVLDLLSEASLPFVTIGRVPDRPAFTNWVGSRDEDDAVRILRLLRDRGAERIALVTGCDRNSWNLGSTAAYLRWIREYGGEPRVVARPEADGMDGGRSAARKLLKGGELPDAVYCLTGRHARGILEEFTDQGIDVPGQVQLVAGADSEQTRSSSPAITAVDLDPELIAAQAVEQLTSRVMSGKQAEPVPLSTRLMLRATTLGPNHG
ncbi:LacI family DNA-binding transcriptional regulator [Arthrobacter gandavensis]|uniref:LacI family DNA-binding transcriptional regulator n=1 Tax=Arthrobacter gandavensis TaxID=169960 RepID=UPI00189073E9|nr:LacI family DNA-binding transcriptional regulator [Arthrobacter gandavensis]MBF4992619.1 LacI family DNA-binding transcriptional regulator [Arthrobacter gandavensis]